MKKAKVQRLQGKRFISEGDSSLLEKGNHRSSFHLDLISLYQIPKCLRQINLPVPGVSGVSQSIFCSKLKEKRYYSFQSWTKVQGIDKSLLPSVFCPLPCRQAFPWHNLFQQMGSTDLEPKLVLFSGAVESACG